MELKGEITNNIIIVKEFNTSFSTMDKTIQTEKSIRKVWTGRPP